MCVLGCVYSPVPSVPQSAVGETSPAESVLAFAVFQGLPPAGSFPPSPPARRPRPATSVLSDANCGVSDADRGNVFLLFLERCQAA